MSLVRGATVTIVCRVWFPPQPLAVKVKVVVPPGLTDRLPKVATVPIPPSMDTEFAFDTDQFRVVELPAVMRLGEAVKYEILGAGQTVGVMMNTCT